MIVSQMFQGALSLWECRPSVQFLRGFAACYLMATGLETMLFDLQLSACMAETLVFAMTWPLWLVAAAFGIPGLVGWTSPFIGC